MQTASIASWNNFLPIVPPPTHPPSRTHGAPPGLTAHAAASHRGHPGHLGGTPGGAPAAAVTTHSVSVAQQQREREEYDKVRDIREIRERENLAAERQVQRQAEARDHIAAQQRAAYYAASPAQQVCLYVIYWKFSRVDRTEIWYTVTRLLSLPSLYSGS